MPPISHHKVPVHQNRKEGNDEYQVTGNLTIRGVTRPVVLEVDSVTPEIKDPWGFFRRGAAATTKISRKEFGVYLQPSARNRRRHDRR